jgi:hypothetical protein
LLLITAFYSTKEQVQYAVSTQDGLYPVSDPGFALGDPGYFLTPPIPGWLVSVHPTPLMVMPPLAYNFGLEMGNFHLLSKFFCFIYICTVCIQLEVGAVGRWGEE